MIPYMIERRKKSWQNEMFECYIYRSSMQTKPVRSKHKMWSGESSAGLHVSARLQGLASRWLPPRVRARQRLCLAPLLFRQLQMRIPLRLRWKCQLRRFKPQTKVLLSQCKYPTSNKTIWNFQKKKTRTKIIKVF